MDFEVSNRTWCTSGLNDSLVLEQFHLVCIANSAKTIEVDTESSNISNSFNNCYCRKVNWFNDYVIVSSNQLLSKKTLIVKGRRDFGQKDFTHAWMKIQQRTWYKSYNYWLGFKLPRFWYSKTEFWSILLNIPDEDHVLNFTVNRYPKRNWNLMSAGNIEVSIADPYIPVQANKMLSRISVSVKL